LYQLALLELDLTGLPKRILDARIAITHRLAELATWKVEERTALLGALSVLQDLARMTELKRQTGLF
jgi:hypothetical protein